MSKERCDCDYGTPKCTCGYHQENKMSIPDPPNGKAAEPKPNEKKCKCGAYNGPSEFRGISQPSSTSITSEDDPTTVILGPGPGNPPHQDILKLMPNTFNDLKNRKFANDHHPLKLVQKNDMINNVAKAYEGVMDALEIDWRNDPNSKETPMRVAKSWVNDLAIGRYGPEPKITAFDNLDKYDGIVFQGNITVNSFCSHHHLPFVGHAHVAYLPGNKIIGLSKLNRIVEFFARRPQVQENLTMQIHTYLDKICDGNGGIAVYIEADHMCARLRGVKHESTMMTTKLSGGFKNDEAARKEFYDFIENLQR